MADNCLPIIDCDIHPLESSDYPLAPFIPAAFREAIAQGLGGGPGHGYQNPCGVNRRDVQADSPDAIIREHLDHHGVTYGVLQPPGMYASMTHNLDVGSAQARAWNDWLCEHYLAADDRFLGSISVNMNDPDAAVAEIHRMADHPRMVQVLICGESLHLYGHRVYWPIYQACAEHDLPVAIHPGTEGAYHSSTPVGRPSSYFQWHTLIPLTYQAHLVSLVAEGVFEQFPSLRVLLVEGGVAWLAHTMWRMDKNFKALRATAPWLKRRPSEYIIEHVRLTTQPIEEPDRPEQLQQMFQMIHADRTLCFSTDFPHWDFDDPGQALLRRLEPDLRERIFYDNAAQMYHLPPREPVQARPGAAGQGVKS